VKQLEVEITVLKNYNNKVDDNDKMPMKLNFYDRNDFVPLSCFLLGRKTIDGSTEGTSDGWMDIQNVHDHSA
jgi:hypothetical protein